MQLKNAISKVEELSSSYEDVKKSVMEIACMNKNCVEQGIAEEICKRLGD